MRKVIGVRVTAREAVHNVPNLMAAAAHRPKAVRLQLAL
jgi:hypothetical protein